MNETLDRDASTARVVQSEPASSRWVKVWDLPTRLFHWGLVIIVAVSVFTGFFTPDLWVGVHILAGFGLAALMIFRLVWGISGPEYSRIVSFIYPPRDTLEHMRGIFLLRPAHYVGHNPTGALMVFALAGILFSLVATGLLVLGGEEKQGPLGAVISYSVGVAAKHVHLSLVVVLLSMVALHIAGVAVESLLLHENLVRAMITGRKSLPPEASVPTPRTARPVVAVILFIVLAGGAAGILQWLSGFPPPHGLRLVHQNPVHQKECGACHFAPYPGLLPASSWAGLITSLADHFGEDATLDGPTTQLLAEWLVANAAETFDTESSIRFRVVAPEDPYRISSTPYWVAKHARITPDVFMRKSIKSKANCNACHIDAGSGRFYDQNIAIPEEEPRQ